MTQFAIFTGDKPEFKQLEFVPLLEHHVKDYTGEVLSENEKDMSWVLKSTNSELIDEICGEAMEPAQLAGTIKKYN